MTFLKASSHSLCSCSCSHLNTNCLPGVCSLMSHCQRPPLVHLLLPSETEYPRFSVPMKTAPSSTASYRKDMSHLAFDLKQHIHHIHSPGYLYMTYQWSFIIYKLSVHGAQCEPPLLEWLPLLKAHKQRNQHLRRNIHHQF